MLLVWLMLTAALAGGAQTSDVPPREREILIEFFAATDGERWTDKSGWGSDQPVCQWRVVFGGYIDFDASRPTVTSLSLGFNNLHGSVPSSLGALAHLERLSVSGNQLTGPLPEPLLERWDAHAFELDAIGTRFSNMVAIATVTVASTGALCSPTSDLHYTATYDAASMKAAFESVRCARSTGRRTECIVREGQIVDMDRSSRAIALLTTTATWGDGRHKTVKSYGRQGPVQAWTAQQVFLALEAETSWERESRKPRCRFER